MSLPLNCTLLCANGAAYDINPATANTHQTQNANGIIIAFRGTLSPTEPDSLMDWLQDLFAEPVAFKGLPGEVLVQTVERPGILR
jgi:hypothetical protein